MNTQQESLPVGALLLYIRGAIANLNAAMSTQDASLILNRRMELNDIVEQYSKITTSANVSAFLKDVGYYLNEEVRVSKTMLLDSSFWLSQQIVLVSS